MQAIKKPNALVIISILLILIGWRTAQETGMAAQSPIALDAREIRLESGPTTELLHTNLLKVRSRSTRYRPTGTVPVLTLAEVTDRQCRSVLDGLMRRYSSDAQVYYMSDVVAARGDRAAMWVNRASGAFKYTQIAELIPTPVAISSEQAVRRALDQLCSQGLIRLEPGEELDLLYVSEVCNRVTNAGAEVAPAGFVSYYYVAFGRRYLGIPIVGSQIVVRLDGQGNVAMLEAQWRRIVPLRAREARLRDEDMEDLIIQTPQFRERFGERRVSRRNITILDMKCGYIEAPVDYRQNELRPGCRVVFRVGTRTNEEPVELTVPLETGVTPDRLLGARFDGQGR